MFGAMSVTILHADPLYKVGHSNILPSTTFDKRKTHAGTRSSIRLPKHFRANLLHPNKVSAKILLQNYDATLTARQFAIEGQAELQVLAQLVLQFAYASCKGSLQSML